MKIVVTFVLLGVLVISCQSRPKPPVTASIWGEGAVSTSAPEFAATLNSDETEVFFNRTTADRSSMKLMYSVYENKKWSEAKNLSFSTGEYRDVDPFLTADGNRLYFTSTRPVIANDKGGVYNTWYVDRLEDKWSEPIHLDFPFNSDSTDIFITMSKNGNAYFVSERFQGRDIVVVKNTKDGYKQAEKIVLQLNGEPIYASNPSISSNEDFLIVAARDPKGKGDADLFVSWNENGVWTELENLGAAVNSEYTEFAPGLSKNDEVLYFTSERPGVVGKRPEGERPPGDIYYVDLKSVLQNLKQSK
ncbi:hypothetical protein M0D21_04000 [Aquimarina sp. D1M17]|uniref:hypothetical protein n=1 Tax=Aquimarina acroporae TaxID=2937283 RepID=UPI0020BECE90|nr:hypothetical protein [Aquimarina acroporae]MCK8520715.1 hypothetical protein [Aquimarina acroporae]